MKTSVLPHITVLLGPTASGKSAWALQCARMFGFEIINADSRQIYKELTIGTAKPVGKWGAHPHTGEQVYMVEGIPHYLMDCVKVTDAYTVADWKCAAEERIHDITRRGTRTLVVGGTGLYIDALVKNFQMPARAANPRVRDNLQKKTLAELVQLLRARDPESAARIDLNNPRRVVRALEFVLETGASFVAAQKQRAPLCEALEIGIRVPFDELTRRINERVDAMMRNGLVEEVHLLLRKGCTEDMPALQSVGYRELIAYTRGALSLEEAITRIKIATRQYAKRQMTWFKRNAAIRWVSSLDEAQKIIGDC